MATLDDDLAKAVTEGFRLAQGSIIQPGPDFIGYRRRHRNPGRRLEKDGSQLDETDRSGGCGRCQRRCSCSIREKCKDL
ncbi:Uncharacterised protein [Leclercia adecarboxylata]|uniref:Uncharacterized protein n=1 Tax=Leclercia adecarboxylata TaxID=83655 RepID=A0A4U9I2Z7_9ENTR|nr:Uncharacterised protein [Leclercia adecarboxylata]